MASRGISIKSRADGWLPSLPRGEKLGGNYSRRRSSRCGEFKVFGCFFGGEVAGSGGSCFSSLKWLRSVCSATKREMSVAVTEGSGN